MTDHVTQLPESFNSDKAISVSLGIASPLWLAFAGAAVAGSAFWWMSRWTRPDNLETMFDLPARASAPEAAEPAAEIAATAAATAIEATLQETAALVEGLADVDPVVEPPPKAAPVENLAADDLTKLVGVGPKLAAALAELGVTSFAQIAAWTAEDVARFDTALALKGRAGRDAWVAQARRLAEA
jgi:predicted flap endonuclease-1-like 5' DNA nuclease